MVNDFLLFVDSGNCAVLVLLDLSAALDHCILLNRLKTEVCICNSALDWFESYFTFSVELGQSHSSPASVTGGVPQGSILGPILFALYTLIFFSFTRSHITFMRMIPSCTCQSNLDLSPYPACLRKQHQKQDG